MSAPNSRLVWTAEIKQAFHGLIKSLGGLEGAATCTRVKKSQLAKYQSPYETEIPDVDIVVDLEIETKNPLVTKVMAAQSGYVLVKLPDLDPSALNWSNHLGLVAKEAADVLSHLGIALSDDGLVTYQESIDLQLRKEIREAMEALARLDLALKAIEDRP